MPKRKKKAYIVVDKIHNYMQGAFPYDDIGKEKANNLIEELERKNKVKFVLKTK